MKISSQLPKLVGLSILLSLTSCEKDNEDQLLKNQITGTWRSTNSLHRSYTFREDNTFTDSLFTFSNNMYNVREVISGNYAIKNGELTFSDINLTYFKGQESPYVAGHMVYYDQNFVVSFKADELVLNQKDLFAAVTTSNKSIIGKWYHNKLVAVYDSQQENKFTGGIIKGVYDFKSDSTLDWQYQIFYDNNAGNIEHWGVEYEISDSKLNIYNWSIYNATVSFTQNNMIWLYTDETFEREK